MARKQKKYHFIYKTTNLLSGKYYIGIHSTDDLNDGYMGSGRRLRYSIRKHGKDNHKVEILEFVESRKELYLREEEIVNLNEIAKKDCMNLCVGGVSAGFIDEEHRKKCSEAGNLAFIKRMKEDKVFREEFSKRRAKTNRKMYMDGIVIPPDWTDRKHTSETKSFMSKAKKGEGIGKANSQYGTCWITKEGTNKKIKKEDLEIYTINGWSIGRK